MVRTSAQLSLIDGVGSIGKNTYDYVENNNFIENNGAKYWFIISCYYYSRMYIKYQSF